MTHDHRAIGLQRGTVRIVAFDPKWRDLFHAEAERLDARLRAVGLAPLAFEHIGSTAVAGMIAKPIIDMMGGYQRAIGPQPYVDVLVNAGLERRGSQGAPGRELFVLGPENERTHHLNLVERGAEFWRTHLLFRDRLRSEPTLAAAYATLKQRLAAQYPGDRAAYTLSKEAFVRQAIEP